MCVMAGIGRETGQAAQALASVEERLDTKYGVVLLQPAYTGYKVKTYRNVYSGDGKLISSTFEASSNYKARNRIVLVGKSAAVTPTAPTTPVDPVPPTDPGTGESGTTGDNSGTTGSDEMPEWLRP